MSLLIRCITSSGRPIVNACSKTPRRTSSNDAEEEQFSTSGILRKPLSPYSRYVQQAAVEMEESGQSTSNLIKDVSEKWKMMSEEDKRPYFEAYDIERSKYTLKMSSDPDFARANLIARFLRQAFKTLPLKKVRSPYQNRSQAFIVKWYHHNWENFRAKIKTRLFLADFSKQNSGALPFSSVLKDARVAWFNLTDEEVQFYQNQHDALTKQYEEAIMAVVASSKLLEKKLKKLTKNNVKDSPTE